MKTMRTTILGFLTAMLHGVCAAGERWHPEKIYSLNVAHQRRRPASESRSRDIQERDAERQLVVQFPDLMPPVGVTITGRRHAIERNCRMRSRRRLRCTSTSFTGQAWQDVHADADGQDQPRWSRRCGTGTSGPGARDLDGHRRSGGERSRSSRASRTDVECDSRRVTPAQATVGHEDAVRRFRQERRQRHGDRSRPRR